MHARPVWHCNHTAAAPPWVIDILCAGSSRHTSTIHKARGVYALTFIQLGTIQALRSPAYFDRSPSPKSAVTFNRNHRSRVSEISGHVRRNTQSILREHVGAWFEEDDDVPFMMQVFQIREAKPGSVRRFRR